MYRFYRKINANGHSNTDFFTEGNEESSRSSNRRGPQNYKTKSGFCEVEMESASAFGAGSLNSLNSYYRLLSY
jgi:hypothetical protein